MEPGKWEGIDPFGSVPDDIRKALAKNVEESRWRERHPAHARSGWSIAQDVITGWVAAVGFLVVIGGFIWYLATRK